MAVLFQRECVHSTQAAETQSAGKDIQAELEVKFHLLI